MRVVEDHVKRVFPGNPIDVQSNVPLFWTRIETMERQLKRQEGQICQEIAIIHPK